MVNFRLLTNKELDQAAQLSDLIFRDQEQQSMKEAFPHIFQSAFPHSYGAFEDGQLRSFMGLVPSRLRIGAARLNTFSLGSVCTHPNHRGKGYASQLLQMVIQHCNKAQASLLFVSGERSLYTRAGCLPFGKVSRFFLNREQADQLLKKNQEQGLILRDGQRTDEGQIMALIEKRAISYEHSHYEYTLLWKAKSLASCLKLNHTIWVAERSGKIVSYAVVATPTKENQEKAVLIDWAGEAQSITLLLANMITRLDLPLLEIPLPWHERDLIAQLEHLSKAIGKNQGTLLVCHPKQLIAQLTPYFEQIGKPFSSITADQKEGQIHLKSGDKQLIMEPTHFISLLFDPDFNGSKLNEEFDLLFPIPLPYTAGLNYI